MLEPAGLLHPFRRQHLCRLPDHRKLKLPNGEIWRNIVTEEKSKSPKRSPSSAATTNTICSTRNVRAFNAEVPVLAQWDDHEVTNDWWPDEIRPDYANANASLLAARGRRAFREYMPMRQTPGRPRPHLSQDFLRPAARRVHARHAQLSRLERHGKDTAINPACRSSARADGLAEARTHQFQRDLEGDRRRHADLDGQLRCRGAGRRPAARPRTRNRRLLSFIKHAGVPTRCGSPPTCTTRRRITTIQPRGVSGLRAVLGIRLGAAPRRHLGPGRSTTRSARA